MGAEVHHTQTEATSGPQGTEMIDKQSEGEADEEKKKKSWGKERQLLCPSLL